MKYWLLSSLFVSLPLFACPDMAQPNQTERKGFSFDMAMDEQATGQMHQHASQAKPSIPVNTAPRPRPSQADKKGRMHNS